MNHAYFTSLISLRLVLLTEVNSLLSPGENRQSWLWKQTPIHFFRRQWSGWNVFPAEERLRAPLRVSARHLQKSNCSYSCKPCSCSCCFSPTPVGAVDSSTLETAIEEESKQSQTLRFCGRTLQFRSEDGALDILLNFLFFFIFIRWLSNYHCVLEGDWKGSGWAGVLSDQSANHQQRGTC